MSTAKELIEYKKELEFRRRQIVQLEAEIKEKNNHIIDLDHSLRTQEIENHQVKDTLLNIESIIKEREAKAGEIEANKAKAQIDLLTTENTRLNFEIKNLQSDRQNIEEKNAEIDFYKRKVDELSVQYGLADANRDITLHRDQNLELKKELERITRDYTTLSNQMNDMISENRVLREMSGVPENYGFNLEEIKLVEKQKIEEYRGRIRRLEQEVEELEKERVELRYKIRNMSTLYGEKGIRFHDLTADQMLAVDQFARNLKEGTMELPLNDRSRELMREIERLKAQIAILEGGGYGIDIQGLGKLGMSDELLDMIRKENQEVKELLIKLIGSGGSHTQTSTTTHVLKLPPQPIQDQWGGHREGYSFRFGQTLPIGDIYTGDSERDLAALQLQIIECLELMSRAQNDEKITEIELDEFRMKLREVLLVLEQLYKQYNDERLKFNEERNHLKGQFDSLTLQNRELRTTVKGYEQMAKDIKDKNPRTLESKIAKLTSKIALMDINNIRLARKYDCLQMDERELRQAYHNFEVEHAEKDVLVQKRIGKLKEWKVSATLQMQFLLKQVKNSVPNETYEELYCQNTMLRERQAEWIDREIKLEKKLSSFQNMDRDNVEVQDKLRESEQDRVESEEEMTIIKRRLESFDPQFKREQDVLKRIVNHFRKTYTSPEQAFSIFDKNGDGKVSRDEFRTGMDKIGIRLGDSDLRTLINTLDTDRDGNVRYLEFTRKMKRLGVRSLTEEQQIIKTINESIQRLNYSLYEVFQIFDTDGDGQISGEEFVRSFQNFKLGLTVAQIEKILRLIDVSGDGIIEFHEFAAVFNSDIEIKDESIDIDLSWKDRIFMQINNAIRKTQLNLFQAFEALDYNKDGRIQRHELEGAFKEMGLTLNSGQFMELWVSMKGDDDTVDYLDFCNQLKESERQINSQRIIDEADRSASENVDRNIYSEVIQTNKNVAVLEAREQAALNRAERYAVRIRSLEATMAVMETQFKNLESQFLDTTKKYRETQDSESKLQLQMRDSVTRLEAEKLRQNIENLMRELSEARAAMHTYKNMVVVCSDQVRALELSRAKRSYETEMFQNTIRELQADSQDKAAVGKLFHQVLIARWGEASANRKYDNIINEARALRNENLTLDSALMDTSKALTDNQQVLSEKIASYEKIVKELRIKSSHNITLEKAQEYCDTIKEFGEKKNDLEDLNRKLRHDLAENTAIIQEAESKIAQSEEIMSTLKSGSTDEISDRLIDLSERLNTYKLNELRSKRIANESKEKEDYLTRVHNQDLDSIRELEGEVARIESLMAQKEEQWRKKDDERQQMLLNPKFRGGKLDPSSVDVALSKGRDQSVLPSELSRRDDEISQLKLELQTANETIVTRNVQIERITQLREELESAGSLPREYFKKDLTQSEMFKELGVDEANHLADAASKTIETLQEMIDHKNDQLERKEKIIDEMKGQLVKQKEQAAVEISRLTEEIRSQSVGPLYNLQEAIEVTTAKVTRKESSSASRYNPKLDQLLHEKDQRIAFLVGQFEASKRSKDEKEKRLNELRRELDRVNYELNMEKAANNTTQVSGDMSRIKKQLDDKNRELIALKKSFKALRDDLLSKASSNADEEANFRAKVLAENAENVKVTENIKRAQSRIGELTKKLKEASSEIVRLKDLESRSNSAESALKDQLLKLQDERYRRDKERNKLIKDNADLKKKLGKQEKKESKKKLEESKVASRK